MRAKAGDALVELEGKVTANAFLDGSGIPGSHFRKLAVPVRVGEAPLGTDLFPGNSIKGGRGGGSEERAILRGPGKGDDERVDRAFPVKKKRSFSSRPT